MTIPRPMWWLAGGLAAVTVAVVLLWFEPQALLIDERVSDPVPTATTAAATIEPEATAMAEQPTMTTAATPAPVELATGDFISRDHGTEGRVRILRLADGSRYVRIEGLATDNGPDVYVYLSPNPADGPEGAFDEGHVDLGSLQGNLGDQNYAVPADIDPTAYASVVLWCDRFDSAFGAADLEQPAGATGRGSP